MTLVTRQSWNEALVDSLQHAIDRAHVQCIEDCVAAAELLSRAETEEERMAAAPLLAAAYLRVPLASLWCFFCWAQWAT